MEEKTTRQKMTSILTTASSRIWSMLGGAKGNNNVTTQAMIIVIACRQGIEHTCRSHLFLTLVETKS